MILPTRNRARQLESGLALALGQAGVEHEVVVVDDGSTDETPELLAGIDHPRLVVLRNDVPRGVAAARNRGIARARGRYLAFLDDDDLWAPSKLREELTLAERTGAVLVYCDYIVLDDADRPIGRRRLDGLEPLNRALIGWNELGGPSIALAERAAVEEVGGFDERLSVLADWDMWLSLTRRGSSAHVPLVLAAYREHSSGMLCRFPLTTRREFAYLAEKHADIAASVGLSFDDTQLGIALAMAHLRAGRRRLAVRTAAETALRHPSARTAIIAGLVAAGPAVAGTARQIRHAPPLEPRWLSLAREHGLLARAPNWARVA